MSFVPKVRFDADRTRVGSLSSNGIIEGWTYEALLLSENHKRVGHAWSGGGPFFVYKSSQTHGDELDLRIRIGEPSWGIPYFFDETYLNRGAAPGETRIPADLYNRAQTAQASDAAALPGYYATGFKRARPGNPRASVGQFLVELRDLPKLPFGLRGRTAFADIPKVLWRRLKETLNWRTEFARKRALKLTANEFLNYQFGWLPFVSDVRKMYNLWHTVDSRIAQLIREQGRFIRHQAVVSEERTVDVVSETDYPYPYANVYGSVPLFMSGSTRYTVTRETYEKIWFSGSFRYYIPSLPGSQWTTRAKLALFGALPTPELLWEVLPWSWLVDWFSNAGDVISNASPNAVDDLTCRYSFVMKHKTVTTTAQATVVHPGSDVYYHYPAVNHTFRSVNKIETKARTGGGNPFGLNVQLPDLSARQLGILAALGISRDRVR